MSATLTRLRLNQSRPRPSVHVIELGYCGDTQHTTKLDEKRAQHRDLVQALNDTRNFTTHLHVLTLGRAGTIPVALHDLMVGTLGIPHTAATRCAQKLHCHSIKWVEKLYHHRLLCDSPHPTDPTVPSQPIHNMNPLTRRTKRLIPGRPP